MSNLVFDLRKTKVIDLGNSHSLKENVTYQFQDNMTDKWLVAKFIGHYEDNEDEYLIREFKKLISLSGEPEIGAVHFLATGTLGGSERSCYVMDFIKGETLGSFLKRNQTISYGLIVDILVQIASGLEKAHHYGIFHSDLHEENIIIDEMGYVKLIDFAWFDYKMQATFNWKMDIEDFRKIVNSLFDKSDNKRIDLVKQFCLKAESFKGLNKRIIEIRDVDADWGMLDQNSKLIISALIRAMPKDYDYNAIFSVKYSLIPTNLIPSLDANESKFSNGGNPLMYNMLDANRRLKIETIIKARFENRLIALKQAGLITDWKLNVVNAGTTFAGPYMMNYHVAFSSKFFDWKKLTESFEFLLPPDHRSIFEIIIE